MNIMWNFCVSLPDQLQAVYGPAEIKVAGGLSMATVELIVDRVIEVPSAGEKFWALNARVLLRDTILALSKTGSFSSKDLLYAAVDMPFDQLSQLDEGTQAQAFMNSATQKTGAGIRAVMAQCLEASMKEAA